jgi:hypothetical protein
VTWGGMSEREFQDAIRKGLGRAIIYARGHDVSAFREVILKTCLHSQGFDVQAEGTRASYIYELIGHLPEKAFYTDAVLDALPASGDDDNASQRFHIAALRAGDGDERARRAIYESYRPGPLQGTRIGIGFVQLDGIASLLFV